MSDESDDTRDALDSELRSWFRARSTPPAPTTLRAFVGQLGSGTRPTTSVHPHAIGWRRRPGMGLASAAIAFAVVVAGGFLVVAGYPGAAGPTGSPIASSQTTGSRVPSPAATPTGTSSAPSPIDDGGFFGTSGLWAVVGNHLALSTDGGDTWVQRSLVPTVGLDAGEGNDLSNLFVLDANHAWTASPGPGSTVPYGGQGPQFDHLHVVVSRTTDGGVSWHSVDLPGDWGGTQPVLAFADEQHGFLLLSGLRGGPASTVFASADGGATWQRRGGAEGLGSVFGASDATTLWAGNEGDAGPVGRAVLDVSRDGGRTWVDAALPGLVGDIFVNDTLVAPPTFAGSDGAVAVIAESTVSPADVRFYRTSDSGLTWSLAARMPIGDSGSAGSVVIDPLQYLVIDPLAGLRQVTGDGGRTWQQSGSTGLGSALHLRFWDPLHGSAVVLTGNGAARIALLRTSDGGQTWTPVTVTATAIGPCGTADLAISVTNTGGGAGNIGGYLLFENATAQACTLRGAPMLTAETAAGAVTQARVALVVGTPFPSLTQAPLVVLQPGEHAFAAYGGSDNSGTTTATCPPPYHTFRIAPPGDAAGVVLPAFNTWLGQDQPSCAGIEVTSIAPASLVEQYTDLSSLRP